MAAVQCPVGAGFSSWFGAGDPTLGMGTCDRCTGPAASGKMWVSFDPWRRVEPGHGTRVFSGVFKVEKTSTYTQTMDLKNLRRQVFDHGRGAPVEFAVTAADPGTEQRWRERLTAVLAG